MGGRIKIKPKDKDKGPETDVFKVIENRSKDMNEPRGLIGMDPREGPARIRDGPGPREAGRGGRPRRDCLDLSEEGPGAKPSIDLIGRMAVPSLTYIPPTPSSRRRTLSLWNTRLNIIIVLSQRYGISRIRPEGSQK